ncbi:TetR/AcrR family transcriptional regulator [Nocardiopsis sp. CNS-639]|uniref:TetR/AcrR family transcriptional regulator n=1 Tax=Nocardiopsis sp. CNS-639 TaxID=1169153 RepID=UPI00036D8393|nr:TetR/AcrR family transcriptional regulator [Nocardiopsis sp. CNS-639]
MPGPRKDTHVKRQIRASLLSLLADRELKEIPIGQITGRAGVSRVSFYRNYATKEDILREHIRLLFADWTRDFDQQGGGGDDGLLGHLFAHLNEHREFYLLLSRRSLFPLLHEFLDGIVGPKPEYPNFGAYLAAFFSYGLYGWIKEWFDRGMVESADEMLIWLKGRGNYSSK